MSSSSREGVLAVCGSFLVLSTASVGLRLAARRRQQQPFKLDDLFSVFALATFIGAAACTFVSVHNRYIGVPDAEYTRELAITIATSKTNAVLILCLDVLVNTCLACSKLSVVFLYRRIFVTGAVYGRNWMNIVTWGTIVVIVLWLLVFQFLTGFSCGTHFSALWDGSYAEYCGIAFSNLYGLAISDFLLDLWVLVLPVPKILKIHATPAKKLSILGVFLLAFIGIGAGIARMALYIHVENGGPEYLFSHSEMRITTQQFYFNMLEVGMSSLAINLPLLWTLVSNFNTDKMLQSVRSAISLPSLKSHRSDSAGSALRTESTSILEKGGRNGFSAGSHL